MDASERLKWRICVEAALVYDYEAGRFKHKALVRLAEQLGRSERSIQQIFKEYLDQRANEIIDLSQHKKGVVGPKRKIDEITQQVLQEVIDEKEGDITYRQIGNEMRERGFEFCDKTYFNLCREMEMSEKSLWVKPLLSERDRMSRLRFILQEVESFNGRGPLRYRSQVGRCYLDEKWFRLEKLRRKRKFFINSPPPTTPRMQSKSNPTQLMFTAVLTQPTETQIGCVTLMPHYHHETAQRNSANRPAGTPIKKPYNIDAQNFYECMTMEEGLLESIDIQVPGHKILQLDNAPGHTGKNNPQKIEDYIEENDLDIELKFQPPNSPDLNICDLAFFRSLSCRADAIKRDLNIGGIDAILESVEAAFDEYDDNTLQIIFGHLFRIYDAVLESNGDNSFPEPHGDVRHNLRYNIDVRTVGVDRQRVQNIRTNVNHYFRDEFPPI